MSKRKFNADLVSEMTWSECIYSCSLRDRKKRPDTVTWECAGCGRRLHAPISDDMEEVAQSFLDAEWRYRRTSTDIVPYCDECRTYRK